MQSDKPIHVGIKYPTRVEVEGDPITDDVTFRFRGSDDSRLLVVMTRTQVERMGRGDFAARKDDPIREAAILYATDRIDLDDMERRIEKALALSEKEPS